jgi:hypothetical protein
MLMALRSATLHAPCPLRDVACALSSPRCCISPGSHTKARRGVGGTRRREGGGGHTKTRRGWSVGCMCWHTITPSGAEQPDGAWSWCGVPPRRVLWSGGTIQRTRRDHEPWIGAPPVPPRAYGAAATRSGRSTQRSAVPPRAYGAAVPRLRVFVLSCDPTQCWYRSAPRRCISPDSALLVLDMPMHVGYDCGKGGATLSITATIIPPTDVRRRESMPLGGLQDC